MISPETTSPGELRDVAGRIKSITMRTPLIRFDADDREPAIYLKLENLQPIGAFKLRPAVNAILSASPDKVAEGVYTASSGNMALAVAYTAAFKGLRADVLLPADAAAIKVNGLRRLGAKISCLEDDEWWQVLADHGHPDHKGLFVHPVANRDVILGNATIGLEILQDLPDVDTVLVPFGGGGLSTGIALALKLMGSEARVLGVESEHCTPLTVAFDAGGPVRLPTGPSFVSGIGVGRVLDEMWPLIRQLLKGAVVVSLREISDAVRVLYERHRLVAEGAGAAPLAAALAGRAGTGRIACVISGGNLDVNYLIDILRGEVPRPESGR